MTDSGHRPLTYVDPTGLREVEGASIGNNDIYDDDTDSIVSGDDDDDDDDENDRDREREIEAAAEDIQRALDELAAAEAEQKWWDRVRARARAQSDLVEAIERLQGALEDMTYEEVSSLDIDGIEVEALMNTEVTTLSVSIGVGIGLNLGFTIGIAYENNPYKNIFQSTDLFGNASGGYFFGLSGTVMGGISRFDGNLSDLHGTFPQFDPSIQSNRSTNPGSVIRPLVVEFSSEEQRHDNGRTDRVLDEAGRAMGS